LLEAATALGKGRGALIELNGRVLGHRDTRIAQIVVTEVRDQLAYARIAERLGALDKNQRIRAREE
jgi:hypothetical protein